MTRADATELLDLIESRADSLRSKGLLHVRVGDVEFTLAPAEPEPASADDDEEDPELDVLDDPATYGRTRTVPGRNREQRKAKR